MIRHLTIIILALLYTTSGYGQSLEASNDDPGWNGLKTRKGSFFFHWGYNRDYYRNTDIHYKGKGFDFTIYDVNAHDIPEEFSAKVYFNPTKLTIPQFDFRIGYFLDENYSVSLGWDHMKYRISEYQLVRIDGFIDEELSEEFGQVYNNENIILSPAMLRFEHSDGLNFIRAGIERQSVILQTKNQRLRLEQFMGVSLGLATPWTDVTFLGKRYKNWLHVAGWGTSALMGLRAHYGNNLFLQYRMQVGYLNLSDILLQDEADSRGNHDIKFTELSVSLGYNFRKGKK